MKVLVVGSGGREHALAWKVAQSEKVEKIFVAPGNGGTYKEGKCENVDISSKEELLQFAIDNNIDLTVVGPEGYLVEGIVDLFKEKNLKIFGVGQKAAMLEGSKAFSKDFMKKYNVKTAAYEVFTDANKALEYLEGCEYPIVIKADGLAAGKGVVICEDKAMAKETIKSFMTEDIFKGSGQKIVVEEFLEGVEASILSVTDGKAILPFISSKDHKQIFDDNKGPNTGGMGVIAPNPYCTEEVLESFNNEILAATLKGIQSEEMDCIGFIFFGLMITKKGTYLLEYNMRMGDPETEAVLPLMESDFVELIENALAVSLSNYKISWKNASSCCVIAASKGYPGVCETGFEISGLENSESKVFIAGAKNQGDVIKTSGGRVLAVVSVAETMEKAKLKAYEDMKKIHFDGIYYRKDIGK
jgi:phosphoribosylamine--glycine ligase